MGHTANVRRSDRIELELRIMVLGTDAQGQDFMEETYTTIVGKHGAKIVLSRSLVPDQELIIRCEGSGRESDAWVVGHLGEDADGKYYSVKFLDPAADVWGIEFPPLAESEQAVERVLLECVHCQSRELTYLDGFEAEVFEANHHLSRSCKHCGDRTLWRQSVGSATVEAAAPASASLPVPPRTREQRKHPRMSLNVKASVRSPQFGEEIVSTVNISRGGIAFKSSRGYDEGMLVQIAVPYAPQGGNIFTAARVTHIKDLPQEGTRIIGVANVPIHKGWPER
jgi:PilZ domain